MTLKAEDNPRTSVLQCDRDYLPFSAHLNISAAHPTISPSPRVLRVRTGTGKPNPALPLSACGEEAGGEVKLTANRCSSRPGGEVKLNADR